MAHKIATLNKIVKGDNAVEQEDTQSSGIGVVTNKTKHQLILQDLSYYTTEVHVQKVMEAEFWKVMEVVAQ